MNGPTLRPALLAGLALVAAINLFALAGVAYNRSGEPDSRLWLGERELARLAGLEADDSGLAPRLRWQVPPDEEDRAFLGAAALHRLGLQGPPDDCLPRCRPVAMRPVLVVLELDGPAHRRAVQRAEARLAAAREAGRDPRPAERELAQRREQDSRLYAIDLGTDHAALRARYPDRTRHAIVRGLLRPARGTYGEGYLSEVFADRLQVPRAWHTPLAALPAEYVRDGAPPLRVEVAFGQRLEPWILAVEGQP